MAARTPSYQWPGDETIEGRPIATYFKSVPDEIVENVDYVQVMYRLLLPTDKDIMGFKEHINSYLFFLRYMANARPKTDIVDSYQKSHHASDKSYLSLEEFKIYTYKMGIPSKTPVGIRRFATDKAFILHRVYDLPKPSWYSPLKDVEYNTLLFKFLFEFEWRASRADSALVASVATNVAAERNLNDATMELHDVIREQAAISMVVANELSNGWSATLRSLGSLEQLLQDLLSVRGNPAETTAVLGKLQEMIGGSEETVGGAIDWKDAASKHTLIERMYGIFEQLLENIKNTESKQREELGIVNVTQSDIEEVIESLALIREGSALRIEAVEVGASGPPPLAPPLPRMMKPIKAIVLGAPPPGKSPAPAGGEEEEEEKKKKLEGMKLMEAVLRRRLVLRKRSVEIPKEEEQIDVSPLVREMFSSVVLRRAAIKGATTEEEEEEPEEEEVVPSPTPTAETPSEMLKMQRLERTQPEHFIIPLKKTSSLEKTSSSVLRVPEAIAGYVAPGGNGVRDKKNLFESLANASIEMLTAIKKDITKRTTSSLKHHVGSAMDVFMDAMVVVDTTPAQAPVGADDVFVIDGRPRCQCGRHARMRCNVCKKRYVCGMPSCRRHYGASHVAVCKRFASHQHHHHGSAHE